MYNMQNIEITSYYHCYGKYRQMKAQTKDNLCTYIIFEASKFLKLYNAVFLFHIFVEKIKKKQIDYTEQ